MDADKIKNFFIFHCEKMVVALVVAAAGFLIYSGVNKPLILNEKQPDKLTQDAKTVRASIDDDHNEMVLAERTADLDIVKRTEERNQPVPADRYPLAYTWEQKSVDGSIRRADPVLVTPRSLQMFGVATIIAVRSKDGTYSAQELEPADAAVVVEKEKKKTISKSKQRKMAQGMGMDGMGMEGMGMGMDSSMMGMDSSMMGMDSSMMGMGMGPSMAGAMGANRKLDPKFNFGVMPVPTATGQKPIPAVARFIAGTAVMPNKEMFEAYELAFKDAAGYDPRRDVPLYYNLQLQRADVTDRSVDALVEKDWVMRGNRAMYLNYARRYWAGFGKEVVPGDFRDPALSTYIPPVLLDEPMTFTLHPEVPMELEVKSMGPAVPAPEDGKAPKSVDDDDEPVIFNTGGVSPYAMDPMGMGGMGFDYGGGMGMGMGFGMGNQEPAEVKLIRFFDFENGRDANSPKVGRKYVYRIRVAVIDPNFPMSSIMQPRNASLAEDVYKRIADLALVEEKDGDRIKSMLFERWTDWSAPSAPVSLPDMVDYRVGPVKATPTKALKVGNRMVPYAKDEPTAKMVVREFNLTYNVGTPLVLADVRDGTVLSAKGTAELVDPITLEIKKLPDADVLSGTTVIDVDGGQPLQISVADDMTQPGLMLLFDEDGGLTVNEEVADQEMYRIQSYATERGE